MCTEGSKPWLNPLMSMYWAVDWTALARRCVYLEPLRETRTMVEVSERIKAFRNEQTSVRAWKDIPV